MVAAELLPDRGSIAAAEDVRTAARRITDSPRWLNHELEEELRMETCAVSTG